MALTIPVCPTCGLDLIVYQGEGWCVKCLRWTPVETEPRRVKR
jgi:uncharacterized Zn finger protein (UPF0148 family)